MSRLTLRRLTASFLCLAFLAGGGVRLLDAALYHNGASAGEAAYSVRLDNADAPKLHGDLCLLAAEFTGPPIASSPLVCAASAAVAGPAAPAREPAAPGIAPRYVPLPRAPPVIPA